MIELLPESKGNILVLRATGKLTDQDYKEVLIPQLETILRKHGKARLVLDISEDFHDWHPTAAWDDLCFGVAHRNDIERMSIVGGPRCVEWGTKLAKLLMSGEIKCFPLNARDEAIIWVKEQEHVMV